MEGCNWQLNGHIDSIKSMLKRINDLCRALSKRRLGLQWFGFVEFKFDAVGVKPVSSDEIFHTLVYVHGFEELDEIAAHILHVLECVDFEGGKIAFLDL